MPKSKRWHYIPPEDYEIAEKRGISKKALNERVRRYGMDIDTAISKKPIVKGSFDAVWDKWKDKCEAHDISRKLFYQRLYNNVPEEIASTRVVKQGMNFKRG